MPELAEVEFYRKRWDAGLRRKVRAVELHVEKRIFRGTDTKLLASTLIGATLLESEAHAKQMLFRFSHRAWLGVHLGMTGRLHAEASSFRPDRHDHLVLFQKDRALVLTDARQFGRVLFHLGEEAPEWWTRLPPAVTSPEFTPERMAGFLRRRPRLAVKAALLLQSAFPGVGNWMADEILWRARIDPRRLCGTLRSKQTDALWREARRVCADSLATVGVDFSDPPRGWLFHQRWKKEGRCPRDKAHLRTAQVGGRTTRWCSRCQH
jgi:formamidopyrimidine-DNA glycosylase